MSVLTARSAMGYAQRFPLTTAAATLAMVVTGVAMVTDVNVVDLNLTNQRISRSELDELVIAWALVFTAYGVDLVTRVKKRAERLEAEQLRVVHVTMRAVRDIVGGCLTELHRLRAKAKGSVPAEALAALDESVRLASAKLEALEELKGYFEKQMPTAPGPDPDSHRRGEP